MLGGTSPPARSATPAFAASLAPAPPALLYVAFHFPPLAAAGTHRTVQFVRRLEARGFRVAVVTTSSRRDQAVDPELLAQVPAGVGVRRFAHFDPFGVVRLVRGGRRGAVRGTMPVAGEAAGPPSEPSRRFLDWASRLLAVPDRFWTWAAAALPGAVRAAAAVGAEVVVSTSPPHSAHLLGGAVSALLDLPWIVDLRDPWTLNPFHDRPYRTLAALDDALERAVVARARRVILNTTPAAAAYRRKYGCDGKFVVLTNGLDRRAEPDAGAPGPSAGPLLLAHVGAIYGRRFPAGLVRAAALLRKERPGLFARLRIRQVGPGPEGDRLRALVREEGVEEVFLVGGPVPHAEARRLLARADGLLLLGPAGDAPELQVPSKLYEYLAVGRPIVALARRGGAIARVLEETHPPHLLADPDDPEEIARALARFAAGELDEAGPADVSAYLWDTLAERLAALLLEATGRSRDA